MWNNKGQRNIGKVAIHGTKIYLSTHYYLYVPHLLEINK